LLAEDCGGVGTEEYNEMLELVEMELRELLDLWFITFKFFFSH
jgi:elongation factor Tu